MRRLEEDGIIKAMSRLRQWVKLVLAPSSATTRVAILNNRERSAGLRLGLTLTGGHVDLDKLPSITCHEAIAGQQPRIRDGS